MTARKHAPQMNIKGIPEDLQRWVSDEAHRTGRKQNEVVLEALQSLKEDRLARARENKQLDLGLLEAKPAPAAAPRFHFRFIDLFAGVGGFRLALDTLGGECVFSSEWDKHSQRTYHHWFGDDELPHGDINEVDIETIPDHDVLTAGFPCQPFSLAGSLQEELARPEARIRVRTPGQPLLPDLRHRHREAPTDPHPRERQEPQVA